MPEQTVSRHLTAIRRAELSKPIRTALQDGLIRQDTTVLDYGCGHGDDIRRLAAAGIRSGGWDPAHRPDERKAPADIVNLGYVVNVIEDPLERVGALREAWTLAEK